MDMKFPGGSNPSALFCEQVSTVTSLFEQWNECERTVVMYALLKRIPYANLKFLQISIEYSLMQNYNSLSVLERNSNNVIYLTKLLNYYKTFRCDTTTTNHRGINYHGDSVIYEPNSYSDDIPMTYEKKEDVLKEVLLLLPLLKPGNDEAKLIYLSLISLAVHDTVRQAVSAELVQQIFSYLLIHPAISNDDRRNLSHLLKDLEEHINTSVIPNHSDNLFFLSNDTNNIVIKSKTGQQNVWQTIAPPTQSGSQKSSSKSSSWDFQGSQHTHECSDSDSLGQTRPSKIQFIMDFSQTNMGTDSYGDYKNDDHHLSFSRNGTDISDYDSDTYSTSNQYRFDPSESKSYNDYLTVPNMSEIDVIKTRRSNSLTTAKLFNTQSSSSTENLSNIGQKPRSFSLSMVSPRNVLATSGSETRLDELKPNYLKFTTSNAGMSNIGQWLKSLRLHKYVWLFSNVTYEQMMEMSEEYLSELGVTKGARHKLVLCIQKLAERYSNLVQMESDLTGGQITVGKALEDLANMVLTPMKPVEQFKDDDVAKQFFKVLSVVIQNVLKRPLATQDEDAISVLLWIIERSIHNEAFVIYTNQLKEFKFKVSKIKMQFPPKIHYMKCNNGNGGISKTRHTNNGRFKPNDSRLLRRNSNASQQSNSMISHDNDKERIARLEKHFYASNAANAYSKSSSYPSFSLGPNMNSTTCPIQNPPIQPLAAVQSTNPSYHRHSLNNLIHVSTNSPLSSCSASNLIVQNSHDENQPKSTICATNKLNTVDLAGILQSGSKSKDTTKELVDQKRSDFIQLGGSKCESSSDSSSNIGDINSRLEFLCLQMTEQAIN